MTIQLEGHEVTFLIVIQIVDQLKALTPDIGIIFGSIKESVSGGKRPQSNAKMNKANTYKSRARLT